MLERDPARARAVARGHLSTYLRLPNYRASWLEEGFDEADLEGEGSDRLVDALVVWGDARAIADRVREHLEAGADHVCLQPVAPASRTASQPSASSRRSCSRSGSDAAARDRRYRSPMRLEGHVAVVTGGTGGLGRAVASAFLAAGARVVATTRNPVDEETHERLAVEAVDLLDEGSMLGLADLVRSATAAATTSSAAPAASPRARRSPSCRSAAGATSST